MQLAKSCFLVSALLLSAAGCAETYFVPARDDDVNGIRYFLPATYILVKPDYAKGTASILTFQGPDVTEMYAAKPYSWIASNTTELTFHNGVLTKAISKPDSTKVAVDTIGALSAVASKALEASAASAARAAAPAPAKNVTKVPIFLFKVEGTNLKRLDVEAIVGKE